MMNVQARIFSWTLTVVSLIALLAFAMTNALAEQRVARASGHGVTATLIYHTFHPSGTDSASRMTEDGSLEIADAHGVQRFDLASIVSSSLKGNYSINPGVPKPSGSQYSGFSVRIITAETGQSPYVILRYTLCAVARCSIVEEHVLYAGADGKYQEAVAVQPVPSSYAFGQAYELKIVSMARVDSATDDSEIIKGRSGCTGNAVVLQTSSFALHPIFHGIAPWWKPIHLGSWLEVGSQGGPELVKAIGSHQAPPCHAQDAVMRDPLRLERVLSAFSKALDASKYIQIIVSSDGSVVPGHFVYRGHQYDLSIGFNHKSDVTAFGLSDVTPGLGVCRAGRLKAMVNAFLFAFRTQPAIVNDFKSARDLGAMKGYCVPGELWRGKRFGYRYSGAYNTFEVVPVQSLMKFLNE